MASGCPALADLDRDLVGRAADAAALDLERGLTFSIACFSFGTGSPLGLALDLGQRAVKDAARRWSACRS